MREDWLSKVWASRWRLASYLLPSLILVIFAHKAILPFLTNFREIRSQVTLLSENKYEAGWLDSTENVLRSEVKKLKDFQTNRESALSHEENVQINVDRIRSLAQKSGIEVIKTTPILSRAEPLSLIKVKIEGFTLFSGLLDFFDTLQLSHPDLFLEEMLIRQGADRAKGRLESNLILNIYNSKKSWQL